MCGCIGLSGYFDQKLLFSMIESTKHRGRDSSGYYLYNKDSGNEAYENNFDLNDYLENSSVNPMKAPIENSSVNPMKAPIENSSVNPMKAPIENSCENSESSNIMGEEPSASCNWTIGLGHNLLSIFNLINENKEIKDNLEENRQPIILDNLVFIFNGEIYNFNKLESYLKEYCDDIHNYRKSKSDSQLLASLTKHHYDRIKADDKFNGSCLLEAVKSVVGDLDGDYTFAIYDKDSDDLIVSRDPIGVKPMFYAINGNLKGFASEKKALWKAGFKDNEIKDLKPGSILHNFREIELENDLINEIINTDFKLLKTSYNDYKDYLDCKDSYEVYKELLMEDLYSAVEKRVENVVDLGLIFSGGVDSAILAVILKKIAEKRQADENLKHLNIRLYAVGLENSQDIKFSKMISEELGLELKTVIINEEIIRDSIKDVLTAIEDANIMKLGVGMTIYLAAKEMHNDGIKVALSGQGADELFGGYNRYLKHFEDNTLFDAYFDLDEEIYHDIANIYHVNLERDDAVSMANGVELRVPFLDKDIISIALDIPGKFKIKNNEDLLRKHIIRDIAHDIGVPDYIANRPKKAAQYGSGINKILKKKVLRDFDIDEFVESLKE